MLVVDAAEGLAERFLALLADGKAIDEFSVLQPFVAFFHEGYSLILLGFEMVGIGNGVFGCLDIVLELFGETRGQDCGVMNEGMRGMVWEIAYF